MLNCCVSFSVILSCLFSLSAFAGPINLNDLTPDPASAVFIVPDGSSATLYEDPEFSSVWLYGDIQTTPLDLTIEFTYDFYLAPDNTDNFNAYLYDPTTLARIAGYEVLVEETGSGRVVWDITGAAFLGSTVGLEFDLNSWDFVFDSHATVSDVATTTAAEAPVPEASTLLLFGSGLMGMAPLLRKWRKRSD